MIVTVSEVSYDGGTVATGIGTDEDGYTVWFGGDHRMMAVIAEAIEIEGPVSAEVEEWAILTRTKT